MYPQQHFGCSQRTRYARSPAGDAAMAHAPRCRGAPCPKAARAGPQAQCHATGGVMSRFLDPAGDSGCDLVHLVAAPRHSRSRNDRLLSNCTHWVCTSAFDQSGENVRTHHRSPKSCTCSSVPCLSYSSPRAKTAYSLKSLRCSLACLQHHLAHQPNTCPQRQTSRRRTEYRAYILPSACPAPAPGT
jgi:hypothetical protein